MAQRKVLILLFPLVMVSSLGCSSGVFTIKDVAKIRPGTEFRAHVVDEKGAHWALFASFEYGYYDYWISRSTDGVHWTETYFTGIAAHPNASIQFKVSHDTVSSKILQVGGGWVYFQRYPRHRRGQRPRFEFSFSYERLKRDSDGDGLTDIAERALFLNPYNPDTDGDGKPDSSDQNPLAKPCAIMSDTLTVAQMVIDEWLKKWREMTVIVCSVGGKKIEFHGKPKRILCLTPEEINQFLEKNSPGITIFGVGDIEVEGEKIKFDFVRYNGPLDAEGYRGTYKRTKKGWQECMRERQWIS